MKIASLFTGAGASGPVVAAPGAYSLCKAGIFGHNAAGLRCHAPQVTLNDLSPWPAGAGGLDLGLQQVGACACCCRCHRYCGAACVLTPAEDTCPSCTPLR